MRKSDIGPMGVAALMFVVGVQVIALASLPSPAGRARRRSSWLSSRAESPSSGPLDSRALAVMGSARSSQAPRRADSGSP
jgi:cobalamin synthase